MKNQMLAVVALLISNYALADINSEIIDILRASSEVRIQHFEIKAKLVTSVFVTKSAQGIGRLENIFRDAELKTIHLVDPTFGGIGSNTYIVIKGTKDNKVICEMQIVGLSKMNVKVPAKGWYDVSFQGASKYDHSVSAKKSLLQLRLLEVLRREVEKKTWSLSVDD